ncbi:FHA domain-containing protein [Cohnella hongkongensis]|uniref:FHA domain-containing protein n=1 Tax=Cohnella hongkongensis TaxID=178337 RepID=A0ABV9FFF1_9BACL
MKLICGVRRSRLPLSAAIAGIGAFLTPHRAWASETGAAQAAVQMQPGTLPLLAALGIGIAVAVFAVIAFLQLTVRGKETKESASRAPDDSESFDDSHLQSWSEEEATAIENDDESSLTDYTIPMTQLLPLPGTTAEASEEGEPMLCGIEGEHAGSSYRILNRRLTIGRDPARCSILFPYEAADVSRVHCTLSYVEETGVFLLEDNGSSNGTFLAGGERLKPGRKYELRSGERFSLSGDRHWFEVRNGERG